MEKIKKRYMSKVARNVETCRIILEEYYRKRDRMSECVKISKELLLKLVSAIDTEKITDELIEESAKENIIIVKINKKEIA